MKPEEIQITDWMRILLGEVPWEFLIEAAIRIGFIYLLLMLAMRLMGRRMASLMTRTEMAALVSLAAAIGVPMQDPNRGLLPAVIVAAVVICVQQLTSYFSIKNQKFEQIAIDDISVILTDGDLQLNEMEQTRLTHERLFAQLRFNQYTHLGQLQRVYLEANGDFTILKNENEQPGLSILPDWDADFRKDKHTASTGTFACCHCGNRQKSEQQPSNPCNRCQHHEWEQAVTSKKDTS